MACSYQQWSAGNLFWWPYRKHVCCVFPDLISYWHIYDREQKQVNVKCGGTNQATNILCDMDLIYCFDSYVAFCQFVMEQVYLESQWFRPHFFIPRPLCWGFGLGVDSAIEGFGYMVLRWCVDYWKNRLSLWMVLSTLLHLYLFIQAVLLFSYLWSYLCRYSSTLRGGRKTTLWVEYNEIFYTIIGWFLSSSDYNALFFAKRCTKNSKKCSLRGFWFCLQAKTDMDGLGEMCPPLGRILEWPLHTLPQRESRFFTTTPFHTEVTCENTPFVLVSLCRYS